MHISLNPDNETVSKAFMVNNQLPGADALICRATATFTQVCIKLKQYTTLMLLVTGSNRPECYIYMYRSKVSKPNISKSAHG